MCFFFVFPADCLWDTFWRTDKQEGWNKKKLRNCYQTPGLVFNTFYESETLIYTISKQMNFKNKSSKKVESEQKSIRTDFYHHGFKICWGFFKFIHNISQNKSTAIISLTKLIEFSSVLARRLMCALKYLESKPVLDDYL